MFLKNKIKQNSIDILPVFDSKFDFSTISSDLQKMLRDIMAILTLRKESLVYNIEVGGSLIDYIYDNITKTTINQIETELTHNLESSLYIKINSLKILEDKKDKRVLHIELVIDINETTDFKILFKLEKTGEMSVESAAKVISEVIIN